MEFLDAIEAEWRDAVARWVTAVNEYKAAIQVHWDNRAKAEALGELDQWQSQLDKALRIQVAIEMLQEGLAATSSWAAQTFGLGALSTMGFIPLIPVAVIVGSISAVTAVTYSLYSYNSELDRKWNYINANPDLSPSDVERVLGSSTPGVTTDIKNIVVWIVLGGLLLKFGPQLFARLK